MCLFWCSTTFTGPKMKPGTYTATLFEGELESSTASVTVSAGGTTTLNMKAGVSRPSTIFSIGVADGTPKGFLNADKIERMHPYVDFILLCLPHSYATYLARTHA